MDDGSFAPLLGVLVVLAACTLSFTLCRSVSERPSETNVVCLECGEINSEDSVFCKECGAWFGTKCPNCGAEIDSNYCSQCGLNLSDYIE